MKIILSAAVMALLVSQSAIAKPPGGPLKNCTATLEEGVDFASKCILANGDAVKCSGGVPVCCDTDGGAEVCVHHPGSTTFGKTVPVKPEHTAPVQNTPKPKKE